MDPNISERIINLPNSHFVNKHTSCHEIMQKYAPKVIRNHLSVEGEIYDVPQTHKPSCPWTETYNFLNTGVCVVRYCGEFVSWPCVKFCTLNKTTNTTGV